VPVIFWSPIPGQSGVVGNPVDEGCRLRFTTKRRNGLPHYEQKFLHQIVPILTLSEAIRHVVKEGCVFTQPMIEPLLLFGRTQDLLGWKPSGPFLKSIFQWAGRLLLQRRWCFSVFRVIYQHP